jgi:hypothetical protein
MGETCIPHHYSIVRRPGIIRNFHFYLEENSVITTCSATYRRSRNLKNT